MSALIRNKWSLELNFLCSLASTVCRLYLSVCVIHLCSRAPGIFIGQKKLNRTGDILVQTRLFCLLYSLLMTHDSNQEELCSIPDEDIISEFSGKKGKNCQRKARSSGFVSPLLFLIEATEKQGKITLLIDTRFMLHKGIREDLNFPACLCSMEMLIYSSK